MSDTPQHTSSFSLVHFVQILRNYRRAILGALLLIAVLYLLFAIAWMLTRPEQRVTSLGFRLDFLGINKNQYPNGTAFSPGDIVARPVLAHVYRTNDLEKFITFDEFKSAVFVIESSPELDALDRSYRARLSEGGLSAVDRERIENEYQMRRRAIGIGELSINWMRAGRAHVPDKLVRKSLRDILDAWGDQSIRSRGVVSYPFSILSRKAIGPPIVDSADYIVALDLLRIRTNQLIANLDEFRKIEGTETLRTAEEQLSLFDVRMELEGALRFQLRPVINTVASGGISKDPSAARAHISAQLQHHRQLQQQAEIRAEVLRNAVSTYSHEIAPPHETPQTMRPEGPSEQITPQLSDSFLDRLVQMSRQSEDLAYRQKLVDDIRHEQLAFVPATLELNFYEQLLEQSPIFTTPRTPTQQEARSIRAGYMTSYQEATRAADRLTEIHEVFSRSFHPGNTLYTVTAPPITSRERMGDIKGVALFGLALFLISLPLTLGAALLHNRYVEEWRSEQRGREGNSADEARVSNHEAREPRAGSA